MIISFIYACIPVIWKLIVRDESYLCKENWIMFGLQWPAIFAFKLLNFFLINIVIVMFQMKVEFKSQIISMIDPRFAINKNITPILPKIIEASS